MALLYSSAEMYYAKMGDQFPKVRNLINNLLKKFIRVDP